MSQKIISATLLIALVLTLSVTTYAKTPESSPVDTHRATIQKRNAIRQIDTLIKKVLQENAVPNHKAKNIPAKKVQKADTRLAQLTILMAKLQSSTNSSDIEKNISSLNILRHSKKSN